MSISNKTSTTAEEALIIFVRNPVLGQVKTRLAATIGNERALNVYKKLLAHTLEITTNLECDKFLFYADKVDLDDEWPNSVYSKEQQVDSDLGSKMRDSFEQLFKKNYKRLLIIGSDCFELRAEHLLKAFAELRHNDVVLGPANDGGYYLLGLTKLHECVFSIKEWSTPFVLAETLQACQKESLQTFLLPPLNDVDEEKDIPFAY